MTISRYKIMAGILGVSIGGLAVAAQCPRPDTPHRSGDAPAGDPKVPNAGSKPSPLPALPPPPAVVTPASGTSPVAVDLPALPIPTANPPAKLPDLPVVTPVRADLPKPAAIPTPVVIPASGTALPDVPPALPAVPSATVEKAPAAPKAAPMTPPAAPKADPGPAAPELLVPSVPPTAVVPTAPTTVVTPSVPPTAVVPTPAVEPARPTPTVEPTRPAPTAAAQVQQVQAANRFRILLRVGEGEPMFEVKSGDDLVLRVVCEKVDVKSPEKGQGPSSVTATGRVRFVGFGAEGTCDNLSFLAGTGEVALTGGVRVQVKDRIGRVESELSSDRLQYRLDTNALPGTLRP